MKNVIVLGALLGCLAGAAVAVAADGRIPNRQVVGEFAMGATYSTGNTKRKGLDVEGKARYRIGRAEDKYRIAAEYARDTGRTTARRWLVGYQSNLDIQDGIYALGFLQYEDDRFSGYLTEIEGGFGAGYRVLQTADMLLAVEVGPGYRLSRKRSPASDEKKVFGRGVVLFEYSMSDTAKISNELSLNWDNARKKVENTFAVTSQLVGSLAGRVSVNVRHNSDPPAVTVKKTDTVTKLALVYSF
ncbi:MAG: DUF481 domain-containing protein [Rhodospirillaceae bacterium]|nr:DUF481 domain-containing protein [Rhodospirillaceae bacterium]